MLKNFNLLAFSLAFLVILAFIGAGIAIAEYNLLAMIGCLLLGSLVMFYGIYIKSKKDTS